MYTSPDEARSDLFLSVAVYVFGPLVLQIILSLAPLAQIPGVPLVLQVVTPVLFTVLVPFLLIRYRKESLRDYGLSGADRSVATGVLAALPIVAAGLVAVVLAGGTFVSALPLAALGVSSTGIVGLVARALSWTGLLLLAGYATVKASDAFGSIPVSLSAGVTRVARILAIVGGVALALLLAGDLIGGTRRLDGLRLIGFLLQPAGVAAAVWLVRRREGDRGAVPMPVLVTPVVVLAIGPFALTFDAFALVNGLYFAALYGGIGLAVALIVQRSGRLLGPAAMGLLIAVLSTFGAGALG